MMYILLVLQNVPTSAVHNSGLQYVPTSVFQNVHTSDVHNSAPPFLCIHLAYSSETIIACYGVYACVAYVNYSDPIDNEPYNHNGIVILQDKLSQILHQNDSCSSGHIFEKAWKSAK